MSSITKRAALAASAVMMNPKGDQKEDAEDYLFRLCQDRNWDAVREYLATQSPGEAGDKDDAPTSASSVTSSMMNVTASTGAAITADYTTSSSGITTRMSTRTRTTRRRSSTSSSFANEEKMPVAASAVATAAAMSLTENPAQTSLSASASVSVSGSSKTQTVNKRKKRAIMCCPSSDEDIPTSSTSNIGRRQHSCLHEACDRGAPADVVKMMIDIAGKDLTKLKDNHGRTALLIACGRGGACYDVIKTLAESGGKELVLMKSDYDGGTALHWLCMCLESHFAAAEEKISLLIRIGGEELLSMEEHLGQTAYHVAKSKPGVSQTILQMLQNPKLGGMDSSKGIIDSTTANVNVNVNVNDKLAQAKKTIERLTKKNKDLKKKIVSLEAATNPKSLLEMERKFDALLQTKISNLGARVEILMENWMSNLESRLGILQMDDPKDNLVSKCSRFEAL
mmetsp:Transcript_3312/g.6198  ORF Transcript_3312/g.6198 Transcript_3312/m.6198 type:complete len:453 (+) Transcript_3312:277-1635(+)